MGVTVSFATVMHMNPRQKFEIGLHWAAMIWNRPLKCFLMHSDDWVDTGMRITKEFGFTDEDVKKHIGTNTGEHSAAQRSAAQREEYTERTTTTRSERPQKE